MFDGLARRVIDPPLDATGRWIARAGLTADMVTAAGLVAGLAAAVAIACGAPLVGLMLIGLSRLLDGLDGAVARATAKTDRGGYLDIVFDFIFYGSIPLAFALADSANALPAAVLLFAFYANGASFLAFAVFAAKRGLETSRRGSKSLYFTAGLAEGAETIACFVAMCLWPAWFGPLAYGFAALCAVTTASRIALAWRAFSPTA
jgi:phosphatidylglycerophosphate synthase